MILIPAYKYTLKNGKTIADRLGHESVKTTLDTYSHLYPDKDQKLADRLNQFRRTTSE